MKDSRSEKQLEQQVVQTNEIQVKNTEETYLSDERERVSLC